MVSVATQSFATLPQVDSSVVYAQNMACMAMIQAQQWENYAAKLHQHLTAAKKRASMQSRVHFFPMEGDAGQVFARILHKVATNSAANSSTTIQISGTQPTAAQAQAISEAVRAQEQGNDAEEVHAAVHAAIHAAVVGAQQQGAQAAPPVAAQRARDNVWVQHRLGVILKLAFLLVLFEVSLYGLMVYLFFVMLFLYGLFDPLIAYFAVNPHPGLDEQLGNIRDGNVRRQEEARRETDAVVPEAPAEPATNDAEGSGLGMANAEVLNANAEERPAAAAPPAPPPRPLAARMWRAFYQSIFLFFMTLLPWWTPDPRNLE